MKSGKIASQCARKILKLLLILWCSILLQFLISFGPVLPVSLHSAVNSCFFYVKQMTKYSFYDLADAATGMYAELMQRYHCSDYESPPCAEKPATLFLIMLHVR